jgi:hypothetical protein
MCILFDLLFSSLSNNKAVQTKSLNESCLNVSNQTRLLNMATALCCGPGFESCCHPVPNEENNCSSWGNRILSLQNHANEFSFGESDVLLTLYLEGI